MSDATTPARDPAVPQVRLGDQPDIGQKELDHPSLRDQATEALAAAQKALNKIHAGLPQMGERGAEQDQIAKAKSELGFLLRHLENAVKEL